MTIPFKTIRARAEKRKGGAKALNKLLPPAPDPKALARRRDDRVLAEMSRRVFCAGFAWSVIEANGTVSKRRSSNSNRASFRCKTTSSGTI
jgi:3-methyladenine DNA glycosylase Tag